MVDDDDDDDESDEDDGEPGEIEPLPLGDTMGGIGAVLTTTYWMLLALLKFVTVVQVIFAAPRFVVPSTKPFKPTGALKIVNWLVLV